MNRILIEAESETSDNAEDVARAVFADDRFQNNGSLVSRLASFLGILGLNALDHGWRSDSTADLEHASAEPAAFTGSNAGTSAFADATALACSDSAADPGS